MSQPYIGQIIAVGFNFPPVGYATCNGQLLSVSQYEALFTLIGTTYGGDGVTDFAVPDLRGRTPIDSGTNGSTQFNLGQAGGQESVALTTPGLPVHTHTLPVQTAQGTASSPVGNYLAGSTDDQYAVTGTQVTAPILAATGSATSHENRQPFLALNYIIATEGIYPPRS